MLSPPITIHTESTTSHGLGKTCTVLVIHLLGFLAGQITDACTPKPVVPTFLIARAPRPCFTVNGINQIGTFTPRTVTVAAVVSLAAARARCVMTCVGTTLGGVGALPWATQQDKISKASM